MIVKGSATRVKSNITPTQTQEFSVTNDSARLFRMLSDFLYSNKELCVIHELSANAVDAHKLVGKEKEPIRITTPTKLSPELKIRDVGPGLCEDDVRRLLTTYGESGEYKRSSNEYFGSWGIGSKSPAAVTKTWSIHSYHDGLKKEYMVFVNERGIPSLTKTRETVTDETGLEVIIPINPEKELTWRSTIEKAFIHYDVKPSINGQTSVSVQECVFDSGPGWTMYSDKISTNNSSSALAVISYRGYNIRECIEHFKNSPRYNFYSFVLNNNRFKLNFNTGELELSISRETIQYTKYTLDAIENKLNQIYLHYKKHWATEVSPLKNNQLEYRSAVSVFLRDRFTTRWSMYDSDRFKCCIPFIKMDNMSDVISSESDLKNYISKELYPLVAGVFVGNRVHRLNSSFSCGRTRVIQLVELNDTPAVSINIINLNKVAFILKDCFDTNSRVKQYFIDNTTSTERFAIIVNSDNIPAEFKSKLIKASSLPKLRTNVGAKKRNKWVGKVYSIGRHPSVVRKVKFHSVMGEEIESIDNAVYIEFEDARSIDSCTISAYKAYNYCSLNNKTLFAVKKGIRPSKNFVKFQDLIQLKINEIPAASLIRNTILNMFDATNINVLSVIPNKNNIAEINELKELTKFLPKDDTLYRLWVDFHQLINVPVSDINIDKEKKQIECFFDKYPILKHIKTSGMNDFSVLDDYIMLINNGGNNV